MALAVLGLYFLIFYSTSRLATLLCFYRNGCLDQNSANTSVALIELSGWLFVGLVSGQSLTRSIATVPGLE